MNSRARNLIAILILICTVSVLARLSGDQPAATPPSPSTTAAAPGDPQQQVEACRQNLKNIATGLEMYATDHSGRYPDSISQLVPNYLPKIPACPAAGDDTYTAGFASGEKVPQNTRKWKDYYYVACSGHHHDLPQYGPNLPAIDCALGLLPEVAVTGDPAKEIEACTQNLKNVATAMEMYATDNSGHYATELSQLVPNYLPTLPKCPVTLEESIVLETGPGSAHNKDKLPDYFYLTCAGKHAGGAPSYDSAVGLYQSR